MAMACEINRRKPMVLQRPRNTGACETPVETFAVNATAIRPRVRSRVYGHQVPFEEEFDLQLVHNAYTDNRTWHSVFRKQSSPRESILHTRCVHAQFAPLVDRRRDSLRDTRVVYCPAYSPSSYSSRYELP